MSSQPDFFGMPVDEDKITGSSGEMPSRNRAKSVLPSPVTTETALLAARIPAGIYLGTSSWSFPGWEGLVYEGSYSESKLARDGLLAYGQHPLFRTVGIDRTFYAPIAQQDYARYASQVPDQFRFLVKAPMAITSSWLRDDAGISGTSPYFFDVAYAVDEFIAPCLAGLGDKAGPLAFQFPPQGRETTRNPDMFVNRLYRFLKALPSYPLYAVEIRDPELMTQ